MRSDTVKKGFQRAPHRALLHACGLSDADIIDEISAAGFEGPVAVAHDLDVF
jgi:hypothetical protein